jgi:hypothetical protein
VQVGLNNLNRLKIIIANNNANFELALAA